MDRSLTFFEQDFRLKPETRCYARCHDGKLEWTGNHIALADGSIQRVRTTPFLAIFFHLPHAVRHCAEALRGERQRESLTQSQIAGNRGDGVIADSIAHRIEIGVAAFHDGARHVHRAMAAETFEHAVSKPIAAAT